MSLLRRSIQKPITPVSTTRKRVCWCMYRRIRVPQHSARRRQARWAGALRAYSEESTHARGAYARTRASLLVKLGLPICWMALVVGTPATAMDLVQVCRSAYELHGMVGLGCPLRWTFATRYWCALLHLMRISVSAHFAFLLLYKEPPKSLNIAVHTL